MSPVLVTIVSCLLHAVLCLELRNVSYRLKSGSIFDRRVQLTEIRADFDQDLYVIKAVECSLYFNRSTEPMTCLESCDYSVQGDACGLPTGRYTESDCACPQRSLYCDTNSFNWTTLKVGDNLDFTTPGVPARFRIFISTWTPHLITILGHIADIDGDLRWPPLPADVPDNSFYYGYNPNTFWVTTSKGVTEEPLSICPEHPSFRYGTFEFVTFCTLAPLCSFNITFDMITLPPSPPPSTRCDGKIPPSGYTCLEDNEPIILDNFFIPTQGIFDVSDRKFIYYPDKSMCPNFLYLGNHVTQSDFFFGGISITNPNFTLSGPDPDTYYFWPGPASLHNGFAWDCNNIPDAVYIKIKFSLSYYIGISSGDYYVGTRLFVTGTRDLTRLYPLASLPAWYASDVTQGWNKLECTVEQDKYEVRFCHSRRYLYEAGSSDKDCDFYYGSFPTTSTSSNSLLPPPYGFDNFLIMSTWEKYTLDYADRVPNSISASLILGYSTAQGVFSLKPENFMSQCTLSLSGMVVDANYKTVTGSVPLPEYDYSCNYDAFHAARNTLLDAHASFANATTEAIAAESSYRADISWFQSQIQDCLNYYNKTLVQTSTTTVTANTDLCVLTDLSKALQDPCCNDDLRWTTCCTSKSVEYDVVSSEYKNGTNTCQDYDCTKIFVDEVTQNIDAICPDLPQTRAPWVLNHSIFWSNCNDLVFQAQDLRFALRCTSDSDCPITGKCNPLTFQCLGSLDQYQTAFLTCIAQGAPYFVLNSLLPHVLPADLAQVSVVVDELKKMYSRNVCINTVEFDFTATDRWVQNIFCNETASCGNWISGQNPTILSRWINNMEPQCAVLGICTTHEKIFVGKNVSAQTCASYPQKWTNESFVVENFACMVCGNGVYECRVVNSIKTQAECESATFCLSPSGGVTVGTCAGVSPQCLLPDRNSLTWSQTNCSGKPCTSEAECTGVVHCLITEYFTDTFYQTRYLYNQSAKGICLVNVNPLFGTNEKCASQTTTGSWIPTISGCIVYEISSESECIAATNLGITKNLGPGIWIPEAPYDTTTACSGQLSMCAVPFVKPTIPRFGRAMPKNSEDCVSCGGSNQSYFTYKNARWVSPVQMKGVWKAVETVKVYEMVNLTSYYDLGEKINTALHNKFTYQETTLAFCRHLPTSTALFGVVCQCDSTSADNKICDDTLSAPVSLARQSICSDETGHFYAGLNFFSYPYNATEMGSCSELSISSFSKYTAISLVLPSIIGLFATIKAGTAEEFRNDKGALIGVVASSGLQFNATRVLHNLQICLQFDQPPSGSYTTYDFGVMTTEGSTVKLTPLDLVTTVQSSSYDANALVCTVFRDLNATAGYKLVGVIRVDGWRDYTGIASKDFIALWVGAAIHIFMFLLFTICLVHFALVRNLAKLGVCLHCMGIFGLRAASLILACYLYNIPAVTDFPTFTFFGVVVWFCAVWYAVLEPIFSNNFQQKFSIMTVLKIWIPFTIANYSFYIAIMIVNGSLNDSVKTETTCYGLISLGAPRWTTMTIISLIYRLVLMLVAILISVSILLYGWIIRSKVKGTPAEKKSAEAQKLLVVHAIFFPMHCLVLICFEATNYHNITAGVTILLFVEIVPGLIIFFLALNPLTWNKGGGFGGKYTMPTISTKSVVSRRDDR